MSKDDLVAVLQGSTDYRHDFSGVLSQQAIEDLADFLKYGLINDTLYIDYASKAAINANVNNGQTLYDQACSVCHGADGMQIDFGGGEGLGDLSNGNPWEVIHKIRAGQPGTGMPSAILNGWSIQDVIDVLGYSQTLPTL
jgi:thiosulfate dehydrogenase